MKDNKYKSSIPKGCIERDIIDKKPDLKDLPEHVAYIASCSQKALIYKGEVVGIRVYSGDKVLLRETPLKVGKKHGTEYTFYDSGQLELAEPYADGEIHGTAYQYSETGRLMGTYKMEHGTGYDIWRHVSMEEDASPDDFYVSEVHSMKDGLPHGYEWWLNEDKTIYVEICSYMGKYHGITREWNFNGKLRRGYPKYYVHNKKVDKRIYIKAYKTDSSLPEFKKEDNLPIRNFPPEIKKILITK